MWFLLVIGIMALMALSVIFIMIIMDLGDFASNRVSPLDVCSSLNSILWPTKYLTTTVATVACIFFKSTFPVFFVYLGMTFYFAFKVNTTKFFEPLTIVRECTYRKRQFIIFSGINLIAVIYFLLICAFMIFE